MRELSDKELQRWKDVFAKDGIIYDNDADYYEAVANLIGYFDILVQMDLVQKQNATNLLKSN